MVAPGAPVPPVEGGEGDVVAHVQRLEPPPLLRAEGRVELERLRRGQQGGMRRAVLGAAHSSREEELKLMSERSD